MSTPRAALKYAAPIALALTFAQPATVRSDVEDESLRQVADQEGGVYGRLLTLEGAATLTRGDELRTDLVINDPIIPGDVLATDGDGRAELQLADGSNIKIDLATELVLQGLSDSSNQIENTTLLQVATGSILVRAEAMDAHEKRFQIDTDSASIFILSDGVFRIDVRGDGSTVVSSRRGVAEVMAREVSSLVRSGERITVRPGQIPAEANSYNTRMSDEFDAWCAARDASLLHRARVDDEIPAGLPEEVEPYAHELSYYGHWYNNPSYGWVWRPVGLASYWQPYLYGRWVHCPSGLVWVSHDPWGWAPYHYGRWDFLLGTGWVWIPGHVFSGAYVAWGVAPGYFGWCPLGYYDYPVSFSVNFGIHRDPWVYVGARQLYARRVSTVAIREVTVVREIERQRVIVRGRPDLNPKRIQEAPRITQELHSVAKQRPDIRMTPVAAGRRLPFRENERQKLVQMNDRRLRDTQVSRGASVARGAGRSVTVVPTGRNVQVPSRRPNSQQTAKPGGSTRQGGTVRPDGRGKPNANTPAPQELPRVIVPTTAPRGSSQRSSQPGRNMPRHKVQPGDDARTPGEALPERVIPRIIPRANPGQETGTADRGPHGSVKRAQPPSAPAPQRPAASSGSEPKGSGGESGQPKGGQSGKSAGKSSAKGRGGNHGEGGGQRGSH